jgi:hypothetical protein
MLVAHKGYWHVAGTRPGKFTQGARQDRDIPDGRS